MFKISITGFVGVLDAKTHELIHEYENVEVSIELQDEDYTIADSNRLISTKNCVRILEANHINKLLKERKLGVLWNTDIIIDVMSVYGRIVF